MSEEQAEQLMQQMQMLENYFSDLSQREGTFVNILREATASIESIKSLSQNSESETLVPIGMGTYVPTKISSSSKIVLNIGAGIAVEKISLLLSIILKQELKKLKLHYKILQQKNKMLLHD